MNDLRSLRLWVWLAVSLALLLSSTAGALDPARTISQYGHDVWQTENGLPQNSALGIVQTRDGYLWLGTEEGLVRFDGVRFTVFDKANTKEIRDNYITGLFADRRGTLWFGSYGGGGLISFRDGRLSRFTRKEGLSDEMIFSIADDRAGNLWVGTGAGGLNRFANGRFTTYTTRDGLAHDRVLAIHEDAHGDLWIGTGGGLNRLRDGRLTTYTKKDGLSDEHIFAIHEGRDGTLWFGTEGGLSRYRDGRFVAYTTRDGLPAKVVRSILEDRDGNLWVGTDGGGLCRLRNGRFETYSALDGLSSNVVWSVYEDAEGSLWVGTDGGGLNRFQDQNFATYSSREGLSQDYVWSVREDSYGRLWMGTRGGGLNRFEAGRFTVFGRAQGLSNQSVWSIGEDRDGLLWFGTEGGGVNRLEKGTFTVLTRKEGLASNAVTAISQDSEGNLWIGTTTGLSRVSGRSFANYGRAQGLSNEVVFALSPARDGGLWVGTEGGLNRFHDGRFSVYTTREGLANDAVMCMYEETDGTLWIGTQGGLTRLRGGRTVSFTAQDGLFDDVVYQILDDGRGNLWMSCNKGIFTVSKRSLEDFAQGRIRRLAPTSWGRADGMRSSECNGGVQPAGWKTHDGHLWFPTIRGVVTVDPARLRFNRVPPPVILEEAVVDGRSVPLDRAIRLAAGRKKLEFRYTAASFLAPEKVQFRYLLEGFDREWANAGARRTAYYTNLPAGRYVFRVTACNKDGIWNTTGAAVAMEIEPLFYQTLWFYLIVAAAAAVAVWGLHRLRVDRMKSQFSAVLAERSRIARDIHDTLAQGFAAISIHLESVVEMLQSAPEVAREHLDRARGLARSSLAEARRSVWVLRSESPQRTDLATALAALAQERRGSARIDFELEGTPQPLPAETENNLLRIAREAVGNAVAHSGAGQIRIALAFSDGRVTVTVADDGAGFDVERPPAAGTGHFGLLGMRERSEQIDGSLDIQSVPGKGTRLTVAVPAAGEKPR